MKLNIPFFKQEKNTTCGVACVRMVFSYYGKEINESELEEACETGWLGKDLSIDIKDFLNAWKKFSFKGVKIWKSMKK